MPQSTVAQLYSMIQNAYNLSKKWLILAEGPQWCDTYTNGIYVCIYSTVPLLVDTMVHVIY